RPERHRPWRVVPPRSEDRRGGDAVQPRGIGESRGDPEDAMTKRSRMSRGLRATVALGFGLLLALAIGEAFVRWRYHDELRAQARVGEQGDLFYGARMLEPVAVDGLRYRGRPHARVEVFGIEY